MNCYIYNPYANYPLLKHLSKDNTMYYPEKKMTTQQLIHTFRPAHFHIVTDCHFFISLYQRTEVFYWDIELEKWVNPYFNTYATSFEIILSELWGIQTSIPMATNDSKLCTNVMGSPLPKSEKTESNETT